MKYIFINGRFLCQRITGVQRYAIEMLKRLDKVKLDDFKIKIIVPSEETVLNKVELHNIEYYFLSGKPNYYWEQIKLPKYCKKNKAITLINFCNIAPILFPGICFVYDLGVVDAPKGFSFKQRIMYKLINRLNIRRYDLVFTDSYCMKNRLEEYYKISDVEVVYPGTEHLNEVPEGKTKFDLPEEFYLCVGSMNPNKNFESIIKIAENNPTKQFIIIGGKHKSFKNVKGNKANNVLFAGYLTDNELVYLYKRCTAFLFPSNYEGFGIPPLEALKFGAKSVVCNDIPVLHEVYDGLCDFRNFNDTNNFNFDFKETLGKKIEYSWDNGFKSFFNKLIQFLNK